MFESKYKTGLVERCCVVIASQTYTTGGPSKIQQLKEAIPEELYDLVMQYCPAPHAALADA